MNAPPKKILLLSLLLGACQTPSQAPPLPEALPPASIQNFEQWKQHFAARARSAGHDEHLLQALLERMQYQEKTIQADRSQPEAAPMIWQYLDRRLTAQRIARGREHYARLQGKRFPVPLEYVLAIWALESDYGGNMGQSALPASLATLAYDGRRREFAEQQLLALLTLLQRAELSWSQLQGSWAGGLGHTQFIPGTFLKYGVDGNGDGRRNPFDVDDALASTAHYLSASGWHPGAWGEVVELPADFDAAFLDAPLLPAELNSLGVRRRNGEPIRQDGRLWLPGGRRGSAFLLYANFDVIKVYNRSDSYALAVSLLADAIAGREQPLYFPREEIGLTPPQMRALQSALNARGHDAGAVDGLAGAQTRRAFRAWQESQGLAADGFISLNSARALLPPELL